MSFMNPLWLIGIGSSAIPLIIHLIGRRRESKVDFSSLRLLREVDRKRSIWVKVRRLLLLLIRMAICAAVFLLLARPVVNLRNVALSHAPTAACIIIDDSPSMGREVEGGILEAKEEALRIVDRLNRRDEIYILTTSRMEEFGPSMDPAQVADYVDGLACSDLVADMRFVLERAEVLLESSEKINKVVYLISDFQAINFDRLEEVAISDIVLLDVGRELWNVAITDVATEELLSPKGTSRLRIGVANYSETATERHFSVWLDGEKIHLGTAELPAGEETVVEVDMTVGEPGYHEGWVELTEDDGLRFDNRRFFALQVPTEIPVLIISESHAEGLYLEKALRPSADVFTPFAVDLVQPHRMLTKDILSYAVVALNDVENLDFGELKMLQKYLDGGGKACIFLGENADLEFYNMVILPGFQIHALPLVEVAPPGFVTIGRIETSHHILGIFRETRYGDLSATKFFAYHPLEALPGQGLAWFTNGQLAMAEAPERGVVFGGALATSDITRRAVFVPLIHRLFYYLARREEVPKGVVAGEKFRMSTDEAVRAVMCVTPGGEQVRLVPKVVGGETVITFSDASEPGVYRIEGDGEVLAFFPVNTDPEESRTARVDPERLANIFGSTNQVGAADGRGVQMGFHSYELTKLILWILFALVFLEVFIIHRR